MPGRNGAVPVVAMSRFTAAETRLYPMAMTDPMGYQHATTLVGVVLTELRTRFPTIDAVLDGRTGLIARLPGLAEDAGLSLGALPADAVVDAASAVRCRELQAADTAADRRARIEAARAAGEDWFVIEPDPAEVMSGTYRRCELHLPTGSTLIMSIRAGTGEPGERYAIELVRAGRHGEPTSSGERGYPDRDAWTTAAEELRRQLTGEG